MFAAELKKERCVKAFAPDVAFRAMSFATAMHKTFFLCAVLHCVEENAPHLVRRFSVTYLIEDHNNILDK